MRRIGLRQLATIAVASAALCACNKDQGQSEQASSSQSAQQKQVQQEQQEQQEQQKQPEISRGAPSGAVTRQRSACPMTVRGARVDVSDTKNGVALEFSTDEGDVEDLRTRVQQMAGMYEMHRGSGPMMWHRMGGRAMGHRGMGREGQGMMRHRTGHGPMPSVRAEVSPTDKGARLELEPTDPSQLARLRERIRHHQQRMHAGQCWAPASQQKPS